MTLVRVATLLRCTGGLRLTIGSWRLLSVGPGSALLAVLVLLLCLFRIGIRRSGLLGHRGVPWFQGRRRRQFPRGASRALVPVLLFLPHLFLLRRRSGLTVRPLGTLVAVLVLLLHLLPCTGRSWRHLSVRTRRALVSMLVLVIQVHGVVLGIQTGALHQLARLPQPGLGLGAGTSGSALQHLLMKACPLHHPLQQGRNFLWSGLRDLHHGLLHLPRHAHHHGLGHFLSLLGQPRHLLNSQGHEGHLQL